ncbi:uncharacterized protein PG998_013780 [Apiospora kogelbergensis]|uniref:uncharacterized protein n=1 Tax=Apiospora kogelbergensis TaxID=1337665 RepID=UPI0031308A9C
MIPEVATELEYFRHVPWCAEYLDRDDLLVLPIVRTPPGTPADDARTGPSDYFFLKTLNTPETIAHLAAAATIPDSSQSANEQTIDEVSVFLAIGSGVMGFKGTAHGAFLAGILDLAFIIKLGTEGPGAAVMKPPTRRHCVHEYPLPRASPRRPGWGQAIAYADRRQDQVAAGEAREATRF